MKKILIVMAAVALALCSCNKDGESGARIKFRRAHIAGSEMLALASGTSVATKAEGDVSVGPKALYTVSEDGKMVRVSYDVEVEGVNGEVAEFIQAHLIISPGFIFPVGDGWIWLANCWQQYDGDWESLEQGSERSALSKIQNEFREKYHARHGAHYLIRKSDGALFEWALEAGAPDGMDDGFKQPTFLNGWFHQMGKDLFVRSGGWAYDGVYPGGLPSLIRLQDKGNTLDAVNVLGDNITCQRIYPADNCLGGAFYYPGMNGAALGIIAAPSFEPVLLQDSFDGKDAAFLLSIGGKLYLANSYDVEIEESDGKEGHWTRTESRTDFYNLNVSSTSITLGSLICTIKEHMENSAYLSAGETLSWWGGNDYDGVKIFTLDPKAGQVTSRALPQHYPSRPDKYVDGVAYVADGSAGYWECDLSKEAAEYTALDWSSAAEYQSKIVPGTLNLVRFEAASLTLQFVAYMTNGTELTFYASVTGSNKGVIKTSVGSGSNAGMVVTTMIRLN